MLILQPPANTNDLHLRPSPPGQCLCMCAWCWWVCVVGGGGWQMRQQGAQQPVSMCVSESRVWGMGEMILFRLWVFMWVKSGGSHEGCWGANWITFPDHLRKGLEHLVPVNCRPTGLCTLKSKSRWPYFYFAFLLDRTAVYCTSAANNPPVLQLLLGLPVSSPSV